MIINSHPSGPGHPRHPCGHLARSGCSWLLRARVTGAKACLLQTHPAGSAPRPFLCRRIGFHATRQISRISASTRPPIGLGASPDATDPSTWVGYLASSYPTSRLADLTSTRPSRWIGASASTYPSSWAGPVAPDYPSRRVGDSAPTYPSTSVFNAASAIPSICAGDATSKYPSSPVGTNLRKRGFGLSGS